jgi:hypothetical protein
VLRFVRIGRDFRASADRGAPPANPCPRFTASSVNPQQFIVTGVVCFCSILNVPIGNTIDLREDGCSLDVEQPTGRRYFASVTVENPTGEPLTYDWRTYATQTTEVVLYSNLGSPSANF